MIAFRTVEKYMFTKFLGISYSTNDWCKRVHDLKFGQFKFLKKC